MCTTTPTSPRREGPRRGAAAAAGAQGFDISESSSSSSFQENNNNNNAIMKEDEELGQQLIAASDTSTTIDSGDSSDSSADVVEVNIHQQHFNKQQQSSSWMSFMSDLNSWRGTSGGKVASSCTFYSFCSVSMVLTNKSLASSYNHLIDGNLNILLVVFQAVVAVVAVESCKKLKLVEYPSFSWETAKQWAPVNIFFCMMLFTSMASLQYNSVPMVTIFKNLTNILTCYGDYKLFDTPVEQLVFVAFGIMLSGAVAAAWNDITICGLGLFWMALNCVSTSGYVLYMKYATKNVKLSKFGMVFYNNVLCVCFLLPVAFWFGEITLLASTPAIQTTDYLSKNVFAGLVGFLLNFASLSCVAATGPTTYAIVGSVNKIPVAFLGYFIFDSIITAETWFFICISMAGGFLYSYAKIQASRRKGDSGCK